MDIYTLLSNIGLFITILLSIREVMRPVVYKYLPKVAKVLYPEDTKPEIQNIDENGGYVQNE